MRCAKAFALVLAAVLVLGAARLYFSRMPKQNGTETVIKESATAEAVMSNAIGNFNAGDYRRAIEIFDSLPEKNGKVLCGIGISYFKLGDYENAVKYLEEARPLLAGRHNHDELLAGKFLAFSYYKAGDIERGLQTAESVLTIEEDAELATLHERLKKEKAVQENYISAGSGGFKVIFDGTEHLSAANTVIRILDEAYFEIGNKLGHFPKGTVTVILYTEKDFLDVTELPAWAGGVYDYDGKIRMPVRGIESKSEKALKKVLFHEYTHALIHSITDRCPLWFNEGLAEYFSGGSPVNTGQAIPLSSLEKSFPRDEAQSKTAYSESLAAVSELIDKHGLSAVRRYLFSLSEMASPNQAFTSAFGMDYDEFASKWR